MHSQETSADHPLLDAVKAALDSNAENQRLMRGVLDEVKSQQRPSPGLNISLNAGGVPVWIGLGVSLLCMAVMFLGMVWVMLNISAAREEMRAEAARTRQDLQDQQAAWVSVMQRTVNEVKR